MLKIIKIETHIENEAKSDTEGNELHIDFILETKTDISILYEILYSVMELSMYIL